jgi:hypothetical protein
MSEIIEKVDQFIQRFYDLEIVISQEAINISIKETTKNLVDRLGETITSYMLSKYDDKQKLEKAIECFFWVNKIYSGGLVTPSNDLLRKLDECRKKNTELIKDLATSMANYTDLQQEHSRILRLLDQNQNAKQESNEGDEQPQGT